MPGRATGSADPADPPAPPPCPLYMAIRSSRPARRRRRSSRSPRARRHQRRRSAGLLSGGGTRIGTGCAARSRTPPAPLRPHRRTGCRVGSGSSLPPAHLRKRARPPARPPLRPQLRQHALAGLLVRPPSGELRPVADPVTCYVVELDLAYQLGPEALPHELLLRLPPARLARAALARPVRLQQLQQLPLLLRPEARGVAHHVQLAVVVAVQPEDERADRALLLAEPERHHHG